MSVALINGSSYIGEYIKSGNSSEAFEISAFDIVMDVQSDNSYEITETIDVEFLEQRHGIIRSIPLKTYRGAPAAITEIKVSGHKYKTSKDSGT